MLSSLMSFYEGQYPEPGPGPLLAIGAKTKVEFLSGHSHGM